MDTYTVIGFYEETGQIFVDHIEASGASQAFYLAAQNRPDANFISSQKGALCDEQGLTLAGSGFVDGETIVAQADVFDVEDAPAADSPSIPEGYTLVPIDPTPEMLDEIRFDERMKNAALRVRYAAVLAAAPQPPTKEA